MNTEPNEERMRILRMLRAGKITAEDAAQLLDAVESPRSAAAVGAPPSPSPAAAASPSSHGGGRRSIAARTSSNSKETSVTLLRNMLSPGCMLWRLWGTVDRPTI